MLNFFKLHAVSLPSYFTHIIDNKYPQQTWLVLSKRPLYTRKEPPSPKRHSAAKFLVAASNSRNEKLCVVTFVVRDEFVSKVSET